MIGGWKLADRRSGLLELRRLERSRGSSGQRAQHAFRVEADQSSVALDEAADEGPARQAVVIALLEGLDLAWRELQLLRHRIDGQARRLARRCEHRAGRRHSSRLAALHANDANDDLGLGHSQAPVATDLVSAESG